MAQVKKRILIVDKEKYVGPAVEKMSSFFKEYLNKPQNSKDVK